MILEQHNPSIRPCQEPSLMDCQIRQYQPGDEEKILKTFNAVYSKGNPHFIPRTLEQWRWEFEQNPAGRQIVLAIDQDGEVLCQYCCLPYRVGLRGEQVLLGQGIDLFMDSDKVYGLDKGSLFVKVSRTYFQEIGHHPVTAMGYGFPNRQAYRIGKRMLKYADIRKPQLALYRNLFQEPNDDDVGGSIQGGSRVEAVNRFDSRFDDFWEGMGAHFDMATTRDSTYLNWRYLDCPWIPYKAFAAWDPSGQLKGFCVVRPGWQQHPILAVPEILTHPDDKETFADLLRHLTQFARDSEQSRVEFWVPDFFGHYQTAQTMGFKLEETPFILTAVFYREDMDKQFLLDRWYYTLGDMDIF